MSAKAPLSRILLPNGTSPGAKKSPLGHKITMQAPKGAFWNNSFVDLPGDPTQVTQNSPQNKQVSRVPGHIHTNSQN